MRNILIVGGSKGLGLGLAKSLPKEGDNVWVISRTRPSLELDSKGINFHWIELDLSNIDQVDGVVSHLGNITHLDFLLYSAGTWESNDIDKISSCEIREIIDVNLTSFLIITLKCLPLLKKSKKPLVVAINSTAGLDNATGPRAIYSASKMGLKGAVHGLRCFLRQHHIPITCIYPGGLASDVDFDLGEKEALKKYQNRRIPTHDFHKIISNLMDLSPATCVKEIVVPAFFDGV